ncbi:MAG: hypothetical protein CVV42_07540 [Candidatus Riflebacteria bacterium HGW-Riflebacteria-2]|jgi:anti-anti-sigma regulatory factor|nr:MAG: hypothetical protein CVV42_07540 [Candidatus Riflebacteria bacterium HGW-Riflebacteria-2]
MSGKFSYKIASNIFIFSLEGYIEKSVSELFVAEFRKHWNNGMRHFLFDFTKVTIINSVALGDMLEVVSEGIGESDSGFYICAIPEKCHWGLSAIGLLNYMTEYDSLKQAAQELGFNIVE